MEKLLSLPYFRNTKNPNWLVFFRITVAAFCLIHFFSILPDLNNFLSNNGYVLPDVTHAIVSHIIPTVYDLNILTAKYLHIPSCLGLFSAIYITFLMFLMTGFCTRASAFIVVIVHLIFVNSMNFFTYGVDYFCNIALFYCLIFPVGKYFSIDSFILRKLGKTVKYNPLIENLCLRMLQIHLCIAYFFSGFDKVIGFNWWNGESIWKAIHLSYDPQVINVDKLSKTPIFLIAGWGTLLLEMLYPVFMNIRKTRRITLALIISMHVAIALFLGLFFFSTMMIILSVSAYYIPYTKIESTQREKELVYAQLL